MKKFIGTFLLIIVSSVLSFGQQGKPGKLISDTTGPAIKNRTVRVFILAGQSNAVGYNHIKELQGYVGDIKNNIGDSTKVLFWPGSNAKPGFENTWIKLQPGVSEISLSDPYKDGGFGPEIGFAIAIQRAMPGEKIAIIKYAEGGTGIARSVDYNDYIPALKDFNDKGRNWYPPLEGKEAGLLYKNLTENIKNALAIFNNQRLSYEMSGFLWMQGEHEAGISYKMACDYGQLLTLFRESLRSHLSKADLPFMVGEINSHTWAFADMARKNQAAACKMDPYSLVIKTTDLSRGSIGGAAHFDADGMLLLGDRFAQGILPFLSMSKEKPKPGIQ